MDNRDKPSAVQELSARNKTYCKSIADRLCQEIINKSIKQDDVIKYFEKEGGVTISQSTLSKYLSGAIPMPLLAIKLLADCLKLDICELLYDEKPAYVRELNDNALIVNKVERMFDPNMGFLSNVQKNYDAFSGILGTYFCYFTPTIHNEDEDRVLEATLVISSDENSICRASFTLDTKKINQKTNQNFVKRYSGVVIVASQIECCYIVLSGQDVGEISVLVFRKFRLNRKVMDSRMALVVTASAGENKIPTAHRMLISREKIRSETIEHIIPFLKLNNSSMLIAEKDLQKLSEKHNDYALPIAALLQNTPSIERMLLIQEDHILTEAQRYKLSNHIMRQLIADIRKFTPDKHDQKISRKVDNMIRAYLRERGYFADDIPASSKAENEGKRYQP